ncbi:MAG: SDR family oxidoreductase [Bacteroidales bacterium]
MKKLENKVSIITGAGSGMGKAIAILFAEHGSLVVGSDINQSSLDNLEKEIKQAGGQITTVLANVAKEEDIEKMFKLALDIYGTVDVLVNNAGVMDDFNGAGEMSVEMWERTMNININGPFKTTRKAIQIMLNSGKGGVIVNNASIAGFAGAVAGAAYTASKHALIGLTQNTGFMYAKRGIRCNAIAPGAVNTNIAHTSGFTTDNVSDLVKNVILPAQALTNPRTAEPEEIAQVALFLASSDSSFVNGAVVTADGGWTAM